MGIASKIATAVLWCAAFSAAAAGGRNKLPDVEVTDQRGAHMALSSGLVGRNIVVMDFVFTDCASICPMSAERMRRLSKRIELEGIDGVLLLSISRKPRRDTPVRLKEHADKLGVGDNWFWLTGREDEITRLLRGLGVDSVVPEAHAATFLIYDGSNGRLLRIDALPGNEQPLYDAVRTLLRQRDALAAR